MSNGSMSKLWSKKTSGFWQPEGYVPWKIRTIYIDTSFFFGGGRCRWVIVGEGWFMMKEFHEDPPWKDHRFKIIQHQMSDVSVIIVILIITIITINSELHLLLAGWEKRCYSHADKSQSHVRNNQQITRSHHTMSAPSVGTPDSFDLAMWQAAQARGVQIGVAGFWWFVFVWITTHPNWSKNIPIGSTMKSFNDIFIVNLPTPPNKTYQVCIYICIYIYIFKYI